METNTPIERFDRFKPGSRLEQNLFDIVKVKNL